MRKRAIARAVAGAIVGVGLAASAQAQQINQMFVFGDSLSDAGAYTNFVKSLNLPGSSQVSTYKFTTNQGNVWVEDIARQYGLALTPNALNGGTDYAQGGARVTLPSAGANPGTPELSVSVQIDQFLAAGGHFDSHSLVTILAGANDIFQGGAPAIQPAVIALVTQIERLQAAGATNLVVVNLPDIGATPAFGSGAGGAANPGTQASVGFNGGLRQGLQQLGGNVLYFDSFSFLHEILANPTAYGIINTTSVACTPALNPLNSLGCSPATQVPGSAQNYFFADSVHPTTAVHEMFAEAVLSMLMAPQEIGMLPLAAQSAGRGQAQQFDYRLYPTGSHATGSAQWFGGAGYSPYTVTSTGQRDGFDAKNNAIEVGVDYQTADDAGVGVVLSYSNGKSDFGNNAGNFKTELTSISLYGRKSFGPMYAFASGTYGSLNLNNIDRTIAIGPTTRMETGSTDGSYESIKLGMGWDFPTGTWVLGPLVSIQNERTKVSGYSESGTDSLQLSYGSQSLSTLTGSVGVQGRMADQSAAWQPYVRLSYDYDFTNAQRMVSIQDQAAVYPFQSAAFLPGRDTFTLTGGVTGQLSKTVALVVNGSALLNQSNGRGWGVSVGVRSQF